MLALVQSIEWNPLRWAVDIRMRLAILLLRVYAGAAFIWVGYHQWKDPNFAVNLPSVLMSWAQQNPFFFYEDILRYIATPNAHIVALILPYLQMAIGCLLVLGLFTRWTTLAFAVLTLNFFLAVQHTHPAAAGMNIGFMAIGLILFFAEAGQAFGLDQIVQVLGLRYGWIKPPKRKKKRVRLGAPKPMVSKPMPAKLKLTRTKEIELPEKKPRLRDEREDRDDRRVVELPTRDKRKADGIENKLGATLKKLKERQQLKAVQSGNQSRLRHYEPDELDDDDDDEDDDIYAYYGDDDDDDD